MPMILKYCAYEERLVVREKTIKSMYCKQKRKSHYESGISQISWVRSQNWKLERLWACSLTVLLSVSVHLFFLFLEHSSTLPQPHHSISHFTLLRLYVICPRSHEDFTFPGEDSLLKILFLSFFFFFVKEVNTSLIVKYLGCIPLKKIYLFSLYQVFVAAVGSLIFVVVCRMFSWACGI